MFLCVLFQLVQFKLIPLCFFPAKPPVEPQAAGSAQVDIATSVEPVTKQVPGLSSDRDTHKPKTSLKRSASSLKDYKIPLKGESCEALRNLTHHGLIGGSFPGVTCEISNSESSFSLGKKSKVVQSESSDSEDDSEDWSTDLDSSEDSGSVSSAHCSRSRKRSSKKTKSKRQWSDSGSDSAELQDDEHSMFNPGASKNKKLLALQHSCVKQMFTRLIKAEELDEAIGI